MEVKLLSVTKEGINLVERYFREYGVGALHSGLCPENDVRPRECPFKKLVPKKREVKDTFEEPTRRIIEEKLKGF